MPTISVGNYTITETSNGTLKIEEDSTGNSIEVDGDRLDFNTDGVIVDMAEWSDVTFTVDDRNNTFQSFHLVDDPDGSQNYENATVSGSIRIVNRS